MYKIRAEPEYKDKPLPKSTNLRYFKSFDYLVDHGLDINNFLCNGLVDASLCFAITYGVTSLGLIGSVPTLVATSIISSSPSSSNSMMVLSLALGRLG